MGKRINTAVWSEKYKRWQINVQKDGQRRSFYSSTRGRTGQRECNAKADAWLDDGVVAGQRVSKLWEKYLQRCKNTTSLSNYKNVAGIGENYILPKIGHLKIDRITEGNLQNIIDDAYKHGSFKKDNTQHRPKQLPLSRKTLMKIKSEIVSFIKWCRVKERATSLNPESLTIPDGARYKGKTILQPDSLSKLFSIDTTIQNHQRVFDQYIYAYRFQVSSGLRPGELLGLRIGDIQSNGTIQIRRSINAQGEETQGKNQNAIRAFTMNPLSQQAYEQQLALLKKSGIDCTDETPFFQITNQHTYLHRWSRYQEANDIPHISLYELRHTFVSIAKHLPAGMVKPLVGHSQDMDTFGQYGHELTGESQEIARAVGTLFQTLLEK